ncbi:MAG TPA: phosphatidylserine decarboxylase family protein [Candidatus Manganitrophaceae bacterium]|nr:phosphatidylserine decarboxylase family protein [Candidatus Manganitrophaceae bacterium]
MERRFPIAKEGFVFIAAGVGLTFLGAILVGKWGAIPFAALTLFCLWFFRDPKRVVPQGEGLVVAPADGKVVEVSRVEEERFLRKPAIKISIFLNVFNVHVNRSPVAGKVVGVFYNAGRFFAAYAPKASLENEQNAILLETASGKRVVCVQIAGWIARRIVCRIKEGAELAQGERFGLIRFGSRVDLFLPVEAEIRIKPGAVVKGGETILGVLR